MTLFDAAIFGIGLINIVLIIRRSVWNFPFGIALVTLLGFQFWQSKLYSDAILQGFFVAANLYGWWAWGKNRTAANELDVRDLPRIHTLGWLIAVLALTFGWGQIVAANTDATHPFWDASILTFSLAAQILMGMRFVQNWHWWIVVNVLQIPLYVVKGLSGPAALYVVFLGLSIYGLISWRRAQMRQAAA
jgi:nicotinamide mononucleotide transporter